MLQRTRAYRVVRAKLTRLRFRAKERARRTGTGVVDVGTWTRKTIGLLALALRPALLALFLTIVFTLLDAFATALARGNPDHLLFRPE